MFVIVGSRKNKALVLDTKDKVVEDCSWGECQFYTSKGFNIIGFNNSFRLTVDKNGDKKYSMHFDIEHQLGTDGMNEGNVNIVNVSETSGYMHKVYKRYRGIRISGSLSDYTFTGDVFHSYLNNDNFELLEMESLSYLQQVIFQDVFLYTLFMYTMKFYKQGKSCSIGVDIIHEKLINEPKMTPDGVLYSENLLAYFRYVYGVLYNNDLLAKTSPTFTMLNYEFFNVDFNRIKSEWEVFEYKNHVYFCDSKVCVWISKEELIDKAVLARKVSVNMMKNKLAARVDGDFTVNPSDGTIIVRNANKVTIDDEQKYAFMGGSEIKTIVIDTNNPNISIKTDSTKGICSRNTIRCDSIIINSDELLGDGDLLSTLGLASWTSDLTIDIKHFDYYFNIEGGSYIYFNSINFTGVDDKSFSNLVRSKIKDLGIDKARNIGIISPKQHRFCNSLESHLFTKKFNCLDEDLKEIIKSVNFAKSLYSLFYNTDLSDLLSCCNKINCGNVTELCNEFRKNNSLDTLDYRDLFTESYPDIPTDSYLTEEWIKNNGVETLFKDFIFDFYNKTYKLACDLEQNYIYELQKEYNIPAWLLVTYSNQVPDGNGTYTDEIRKKIFKSDIKKKRWGRDTDKVIEYIDNVIKTRIFKKGYKVD